MNVTRTVAVTALAAGFATTACSGGGGRTPTTVITVAPAPTSTATAPGNNVPPPPTTDPLDIDTTSASDPTGSPVDFAIRYLNDLRTGRWSAALDEMAYVERTTIALDDSATAVGEDVLFNASGGTGQLARCTSGRHFASDAVIIRCGRANVVVHVQTTAGFRGVQVSPVFVAGDHPGQPHTHAYSHLV
jgi:hypothetical protein